MNNQSESPASNFLPRLKLGVLIASQLFCWGCNTMLFKEPMPREAEVVRDLPAFLEGVYQDEDGFTQYEILKINKGHCIVQSYQSIPKDSLLAFVAKSKSDTMSAELKGSTVIVSSKDTTYQINFVLINGRYETVRSPKYEINLIEGYFIDDFTKDEKKKSMLRKYKNDYFLNIVANDNWLLVRWQKTAEKLLIQKSVIADSTFSETNTYYNGITKITKLDNETYLANPTDKEFFTLMEEPKLFKKEIWVKVDRPDNGNSWLQIMLYASLATIFALFVVVVLLLMARKKK